MASKGRLLPWQEKGVRQRDRTLGREGHQHHKGQASHYPSEGLLGLQAAGHILCPDQGAGTGSLFLLIYQPVRVLCALYYVCLLQFVGEVREESKKKEKEEGRRGGRD